MARKAEIPKFEFKKIPLPVFIKTDGKAYAANLYPLDKLVVDGEALFIHNRSMSGVVYAIKAYLDTHEKELFFVKQINEGIAIWRVATKGKGVVTPNATKPIHSVSILVDKPKPKKPIIQLAPIEEVYPINKVAFEHLFTPSGKRQTSNLSEDEVNEIVSSAKLGVVNRKEIAIKFNIWPATIGELIQKLKKV